MSRPTLAVCVVLVVAGTRPWIRVQLQRDDDPSCYDSVLLTPFPPEAGVTVAQVEQALTQLRSSPELPKSEATRALAAWNKAVRWVRARPPAGWNGRQSMSFYFDKDDTYECFRFDLENIEGHDLKG